MGAEGIDQVLDGTGPVVAGGGRQAEAGLAVVIGRRARHGDEVVVQIERIGRLANRCRHRPAP